MARLNKLELVARFVEALKMGGWGVLFLSKDEHPARFQVFKEGSNFAVRVYIWNISHGGKGRNPDEFRIQVTGFDHLTNPAGVKTVILGWWDDAEVFAGWDIRQHLAPLGASPSMQISRASLQDALLNGFAPYRNAKGETAIAIRPDFMGTYLRFLDDLHDSGKVPAEAALLEKLSADPDDVDEAEIDAAVAAARKHAIVTTRKALRALDFSKRILGAYGHRCAMCSTQLRLVDGAHILPVAHADSTDETSNGVALCAIHHRAYDRGLVTFKPDYSVVLNEVMASKLKKDDRNEGLKSFRAGLRPVIHIPPDKKDRLSKKFVVSANSLRGW
ncbi:HNH endonuclease [Mesorhizobium sp. WSM3866]|uniref:HNH endonuclease n=1 Tax=Mesorhizobium sp. WSM3866 TaxID=422271 RepID=UPI000BAEB059|nr:HNH endonuclease [Mesorhizobium sp. WSM3866]PBB41190.1 HNH endonuclease [Mesorhizobium sp. WSM3866]